MSFGIILATHAHVGEAMLEAAEMLSGKQERVRALSLTPDTTVSEFEDQLVCAYDELAATYDHVVALCDIYGGSPFNVISRVKLAGRELTAFTGVSLPVLIELLFSGNLTVDQVRTAVENAAANAVKEIVVELAEDSDDDVDLDL